MTKPTHQCPNCGEHNKECACMRNLCVLCDEPVGNINFTLCKKCLDRQEDE